MDETSEIKLSLLDNSHAFLDEAVTYALTAQGDVRKWQFAVINLVQSLELSLKSLLWNIHPILIYENIDSTKHTVGPLQAFDRLNHPLISAAKFSSKERTRIKNAINLRNQMTHSEFTMKPEFATVKFFEVFGFLIDFQARHFECEIYEIITDERFKALLSIKHGIKELAARAMQRICDEEIHEDFILQCPNCYNDTFVIQDDINTCYTCRQTDEICECSKCRKFVFIWQMHDFSNELDIGYSEGMEDVVNNYGYDYREACDECICEIKEDIEQQRITNDYYWAMEMAQWEQKRAQGNK